jgi:hypothetical protein
MGMLVRTYAASLILGGRPRDISSAVLNANYLRARLSGEYELPYDGACMHELVLSGSRQKALGVRTMDVAKRLMDFGFHPPTVYFPLIVDEALMIEPTESESVETLDRFADAMLAIAREARESPDTVHSAPHTTPVGRVDEAGPARPRLGRTLRRRGRRRSRGGLPGAARCWSDWRHNGPRRNSRRVELDRAVPGTVLAIAIDGRGSTLRPDLHRLTPGFGPTSRGLLAGTGAGGVPCR